ncbi:hypothetical protein GUITHDRAFT_102470 [Guillardia theta CCMP2712]|uniref:RNA helicase n=1 Tax=Guillardia theta (strain CCMP2712) TaxID=905079 RepID=L1JUJ6_GUITC|nr:hypothetical protein GUITHDRAFT_102470 [Guillardia theta CCMP2712]EKX51855.1 hypothetical protein GUITHDRAFT_102470 [Guillardia theta CCMP2712]|eukprot:XP_005838835.1 hypothetical protein GUITHDRAFT_102470 [Guillardia theta CCMP2712]
MPLRGGRREETPGKQTRKASKRRAPADADQEAPDQGEKDCSRDASAEQPHEIHSKTKKKRGKEDHASTSNSTSTIVDGDEILKRLQSLEKKKKEAISLEDFDSASKLKAEIKDLEAKLKSIGKADILSAEPRDMSNSSIRNFRISEKTIKALSEQGIQTLFPIQVATFDIIYEGYDLIARARTGTGKTLAFVLPVHEKLMRSRGQINSRGRAPEALVMVPTRELCLQVTRVWKSLGGSLEIQSVYGGAPIRQQQIALSDGIDVVIGTPGRILDLKSRGSLRLDRIKFLVLDEADQMLEIGFKDDMEEIIRSVCGDAQASNLDHQTLLFSATVPSWVQEIARNYLRADRRKDVDLVKHETLKTAPKIKHLCIACGVSARRSTIVATNVAARGLDIPEVDLVVMCHPPESSELYVHRSGRTGRAGKNGTCVMFYSPREAPDLSRIEHKTASCSQPHAAAKAACEDAFIAMEKVQPESIQLFSTLPPSARSMLTSLEGFKTFLLKSSGISMVPDVFRCIRRVMGGEPKAADSVRSIRFLKDKSGAAFDVPAEFAALFDDVAKSFEGKLVAPRIESVQVLPDLLPESAMASRF